MLELTGVGSLLRGISVVYWLLAISALALAIWKGPRWWGKSLGVIAVLFLFGFFPVKGWLEAQKRNAYAQEAWAYFKKLCDEKSGEKINKTFRGVKSVLVVKPLPPANGNALNDQYWLGDPYSNATFGERASLAALRLASLTLPVSSGKSGRGFDFVESPSTKTNELIRYWYQDGAKDFSSLVIQRPISRFGIAWEDISTVEDRKYWVAASRLSIFDLKDKSLIAERIGYFIEAGFGSRSGARVPWLASRGPTTTCPYSHDFSDRWFVLRVLRSVGGTGNDK